jgi:tRNA-dihydrouridine synthase B
VVEAVQSIPVIGNGDVTTPQAARHMIDKTGCAGVSAGRGAFYNPWIFLHTQEYLQTGNLPPEPSFEERMRVLRRHYDLMVEVFGEERGSLQFRKVAPWYAKRLDRSSRSTWPWSASVHGRILRKRWQITWSGESHSLARMGNYCPSIACPR